MIPGCLSPCLCPARLPCHILQCWINGPCPFISIKLIDIIAPRYGVLVTCASTCHDHACSQVPTMHAVLDLPVGIRPVISQKLCNIRADESWSISTNISAGCRSIVGAYSRCSRLIHNIFNTSISRLEAFSVLVDVCGSCGQLLAIDSHPVLQICTRTSLQHHIGCRSSGEFWDKC